MEDGSGCITIFLFTWKHEGRRKVGRPSTTRRRKGKSLDENLGTKLKEPEWPGTEGTGRSALQPY